MGIDLIINSKCPACRSVKIVPADSFSVSQKSNGIFPEFYKIYACKNCGLWFKDQFPVEHNIEQHYNELELADDLWDYENRLPHEKRLDHLLKNLPKNAKVLDVGCWTGRLLEVHTHLLRYGIEPNPQSSHVAEQKGIHILGRTVTKVSISGNTFDLITMIDVFEHLSDPVGVIRLLVQQLRPGGRLVIVTGRTDSFPVMMARSTYWYFSIVPDHIVFLNKKFILWLKKILRLKSVKAIAIRHYPINIKKYLKELLWLFIWRFANPNSPFRVSWFFKLPFFKRFSNLKDIIITTEWHDHYFVVLEKN